MGKTRLEKSEATNRQISSDTKCNSKQTVEKANEHPEWLPDGWNVDVRTRKSGANMGCGYKCYIDPNGNKFYSKPEVLRYLETIKGNNCTSKKGERFNTKHFPNNDAVEKSTVEDLPPGWITEVKKGGNSNKKDLDAVEKSTVEDLPPGWITEVKNRKGGNSNKKDLFYTDPLSGYVFRSKKDVLRYLQSGDISTCVIKPNKRQIEDEDKVNALSAGKKKKLKQSAIKQRLFVGKEISDESSLELPDANSSKKGQDVKVSSGTMISPVPTHESVVEIQSLENAAAYPPEMKKTSDPDDVQEKNHVVNVTENASKKNHSNRNVSKNKELNVGRRFSGRLAGVEPDQLTNGVTNEQALQVPKRILRKSRTILNTDLENKSSQPLNGVPEIEHSHKMQGEALLNKGNMLSEGQAGFRGQPHQLETDKIKDNNPEQNHYSLSRDSSLPSLKVAVKSIGAELPSPDNPRSSQGLASEARVSIENKLHASETRKSGSQEIRSNLKKSSNKKEHRIPCRASKRLAGSEPELMSNSISYERAPEYKSKKSKGDVNADLQQSEGQSAMEFADYASINGESSNKSRGTPKIPPITTVRLRKHDEEIDEKSEPQQSFEFHYSWSDPCLEFAIKTLTSTLPVEDSVGNGPTRIPESDMLPKNKLFENVAGSSSDKNLTSVLPVEDSAGNGPTQIPETDLLLKNKLFENVTGSSSDKNPQENSKKSKNKKELKMPRRSSKRLAGNEPVMPTERAVEYTTRKSCEGKPTATASSTNGASGRLHAGEESKLTVHASDKMKTRICGEPSNKSEKSYVQIVPNEQLQRLEAANIDDDRSKPQFPLPFGDSWSDPCLEFAIKTLTGCLPVDAAADILPVVTPDINDPPKKEFLESVVQKSINEEAHDNSHQPQTKKELNTVSQLSKQPVDKPELRSSCTSCENDPKFATRESYSDGGNITKNFDGGESLHIKAEAGSVTGIDINTLILEEPLKENEQVLKGESVAGQPQPETETVNHDNSVGEFCVPFMESWSDPCLEFAFKTLTGAIPVENDITFQGCFRELANRHGQRDGGSMFPEFGSSSISQSDFSFHTDIGEKSMPGQQSSTSSSFLPLEKSSLHDYTGVDPQKHYSQCNNNFQRR